MKKNYKLFFTLVFFTLSLITFSQSKSFTFKQVDSVLKTNTKKTVIFIYTDWCKYCALMKNTTFKNEKVVKMLNENFLFVNLNGEEKNDINFNGNIFKFKPTGIKTGTHELAEELGTVYGKLTFPTICILNSKYEIIFQYSQFISGDDFYKILYEIDKSN